MPKVRTYSEWVIDGEYDWPPKCCNCQAVLQEADGSLTTRLGCLHVIHTNCLVSHIKSFPPHTAPAGYACPSCSTSIWPPKSIKDSGSRLHSLLKEAILQTGMEKNLFGAHAVPISTADSHGPPPPAFASSPLVDISSAVDGYSGPPKISVSEITEIESPTSTGNFKNSATPVGPGATTRKVGSHVERQSSEMSYYADDEDGNRKKYSRRGPLRHKFFRALLPFWSSALPTLPVTAPSRKDGDDVSEGRPRQQRASRMDPRKILLLIAIMACMATIGILYYRIAQSALNEGGLPDGEHQ
ncbi:hypothetical protein ACFE04_003621 [Oxalis oulophora]